MKKKKLLFALLAITMCISLCNQGSSIKAAAKSEWHLQYLPYVPTSQNIYSWKKTISSTQNKVVCYVSEKIGNGSMAFEVNGVTIAYNLSKGSSATSSTKKGKSYRVTIPLTSYSIKQTTKIAGTITY